MRVYPLLVWLALRQCCLNLRVTQQDALPQIYGDHLTWSQSTLLDDFMSLTGNDSGFRGQDQ